MAKSFKGDRRRFLKQAAGTLGMAMQAGHWPSAAQETTARCADPNIPSRQVEEYPRRFEGAQLRKIAFPLGGVAAGSISLGGRGQLQDWEIFNRPNKGFRPHYAFPSIWARAKDGKPHARVLESRIQPPYEGPDGLGADNVPGLSRFETATFTGAYPLAHIDFHDRTLPVQVELDAFSPFIPHEPDDSGLPVAILHYRVTNPDATAATVSIAFSVENPVIASGLDDKRSNNYHAADHVTGLLMTNSGVPPNDPMWGSFALTAMRDSDKVISHWQGWPEGQWWNSPLHFWDRFSKGGRLGTQPTPYNVVGVICLSTTIAAGQSADFRFLLAWHFPNRTPEWCGWEAPSGEGKTIIGNYYATRFSDAWQAVVYAADHLEALESRTKAFAAAFSSSTLPVAAKDAASANLSTLATTTCFRTSDGEFHGFEGSNNTLGSCFGNCTHVWNYETVTAFLFPTFARSLRKSAFGYSMDNAGGIHFRQLLPDGKARFPTVAADGQMGQIVHCWLDWKLSGDLEWLREIWPRVRKAIEFAWVPDSWDPDRDGVLEGAQHNTYDVEFYGPNPMCGIYYLAALRAGEEMAGAVDDCSSAHEYRKLYGRGRDWIDANLFNGEYYLQRIRGIPPSDVLQCLRGGMGAKDTLNPQFQIGNGCLIDQLVGQYLADVGNMGPLVEPRHIRKALASIYRLNFRRTLIDHENVARTFALNDEAAVIICDYGKSQRPEIPFPYYSEVWSGLEYTLASLMISWGMVEEGIECVRSTRLRYDGEKRNPWDEAEAGHHYVRAMSSWSVFLALSGFAYDGSKASVVAAPRLIHNHFKCFWATATGWGTFSYEGVAANMRFSLRVIEGTLTCRSCEIKAAGRTVSVRSGVVMLANSVEWRPRTLLINLEDPIKLLSGDELTIAVHT